jgi:IS30 family transposase
MKGYNHITDSERRRIENLISSGANIRKIARRLARSPSTISEEIKQNSVKGKYSASKANHKAKVRRKQSKVQCLKVARDAKLRNFVETNIFDDQSPKGISGRIKNVENNIQYASAKAIYKFVYSVYGRQIEKHLYSKAVKKKGGPKRKRSPAIDGRTMIDKRPKSAEKRYEFGHFEGDFLESGKDGKGSLLVLVERKTRYPFLIYAENKTTNYINNLIGRTLRGATVKSLTIDNDLSFQKHEALSELLGADIFFCHSYSSHEKGTIENRNKAIRRYIPKRSDLSSYEPEYIKEVEMKLRNKFMRCLNYKTPREAWEIEMNKIKNKKIPLYGIMSRVLITKIGCSA